MLEHVRVANVLRRPMVMKDVARSL